MKREQDIWAIACAIGAIGALILTPLLMGGGERPPVVLASFGTLSVFGGVCAIARLALGAYAIRR